MGEELFLLPIGTHITVISHHGAMIQQLSSLHSSSNTRASACKTRLAWIFRSSVRSSPISASSNLVAHLLLNARNLIFQAALWSEETRALQHIRSAKNLQLQKFVMDIWTAFAFLRVQLCKSAWINLNVAIAPALKGWRIARNCAAQVPVARVSATPLFWRSHVTCVA